MLFALNLKRFWFDDEAVFDDDELADSIRVFLYGGDDAISINLN
jgi:hypothetical protein